VVTNYRLGLLIVALTVLISAAACWARGGAQGGPARVAQDLPPGTFPVGEFELVERSGRTVSQSDLADRVCIASFIFTRCPLSCPRITSLMKDISGRLAATDVLLLSFSVDPDFDTPAILAAYARRFEASADHWWFLTGPKESIYDLVRDRFMLPLVEGGLADPAAEREAITHSDRLALIDRGQIIGLFDSTDAQAVDGLVSRARRLALPRWVKVLPSINASLNAACAALLLAGWAFIRSRLSRDSIDVEEDRAKSASARLTKRSAVRRHIVCMIAAVSASVVFLTCYLVYHYQAGSMAFRGSGVARLCYLTILVSHTLLATCGVVPLVTITLIRALRRDFVGHRRIAQLTFPIWLYVSVTGVVIYAMLYHLPVTGQSL
jgi:protein SCO1